MVGGWADYSRAGLRSWAQNNMAEVLKNSENYDAHRS